MEVAAGVYKCRRNFVVTTEQETERKEINEKRKRKKRKKEKRKKNLDRFR